MVRKVLAVGGGVIALCLLGTSLALAQITTGTVTGTVKDPTGLSIPGATVVLISETRGTKSAPAVTNETGDYVFPNVPADTYTIEVTLEAFKTVRRSDIAVSGGDRVGIGTLTLEPGAIAETVTVTARIAAGADEERRALVRGHRDADRKPAGRAQQLHQHDGVHARRRAGRRVGRRHAARWRRTEQHHDGRHLGDGHRQQRPDAEHERRRDRRSKDPHAGLSGRVRPLERTADHRGHQERHEPVQRIGVRHPDQLGLGCEQLGEQQERRSEGEADAPRRSATRLAVRSENRAARTSCSSSTRTNIVR